MVAGGLRWLSLSGWREGARFQALRQRRNGGMGETAFGPPLNARMRAKVKASLLVFSRDPTYAPIIQRLCVIAGLLANGSRIGAWKTKGRRTEPVAMVGVALLRIGLGLSWSRWSRWSLWRAFRRGFWTKRGIFAQRWGLNGGFH